MLATFRDYLKSINLADHYYIGKIDNSKLKTIGLYGQPGFSRIEAIGRCSSYDVAGIRILVHWNKNAKESEEAARTIFESIRYITDADITGASGAIHVNYLDLLEPEPNFIGTDDNGVYEYHISARLYYRR